MERLPGCGAVLTPRCVNSMTLVNILTYIWLAGREGLGIGSKGVGWLNNASQLPFWRPRMFPFSPFKPTTTSPFMFIHKPFLPALYTTPQ